jgi:hypothetical protein
MEADMALTDLIPWNRDRNMPAHRQADPFVALSVVIWTGCSTTSSGASITAGKRPEGQRQVKGVTPMSWVAVRYRKIALPDIVKTMRIWLDQKQFEPKALDYVISVTGTLVRVEFPNDTEAAEFAEAFGGFISPDQPSVEGTDNITAEKSASHGS